MKKALSILLMIVITFTIAGCDNKQAEPLELNKLFTVNAQIHYGKTELEGIVNRLGNQMWEIEFTSPENFSGLKLSYYGDSMSASYYGFEFTVPQDKLPVQNIMYVISKVIDDSCVLPEMSFTETEKSKVYYDDAKTFEITVDTETGGLKCLEYPEHDLKVDFTDFMLIQ